ncbi:MAG: acyltransferase family protein [Haloechinothrix sp.]
MGKQHKDFRAHVGQLDLPPSLNNRIVFVDMARAVAALVVFYVHVDVLFLRQHYGSTGFTNAVESVFAEPFGFGELGPGQVAVCVFFLVSGFVVTPIALRMGSRRFAVNRFFRVYPLLVAVVLLSAVVLWLGLEPLTSVPPPELTAGALVSNVTLVNFVLHPPTAFVGVAWTLAVEVIFYLVLIAVLPLLRRWIWLAIAVELELVLFAVLLQGHFGEGFGSFVAQVAYLLIPIMGQVIWASWDRKIPFWLAGGYLGLAWVLLKWAADQQLDVFWALEPAAVAIALLLFLVGLGMEGRMKHRSWWTVASERSYSLYLMHGLVALPIMHGLNGVLPLPFTLLLGIGGTLAAVQLTYLAVERPSHNLGRRLSRRRAVGKHRPPRRAAVRRPQVAGRAGPRGLP